MTLHSIFYSRVGQIAIFSHGQPLDWELLIGSSILGLGLGLGLGEQLKGVSLILAHGTPLLLCGIRHAYVAPCLCGSMSVWLHICVAPCLCGSMAYPMCRSKPLLSRFVACRLNIARTGQETRSWGTTSVAHHAASS